MDFIKKHKMVFLLILLFILLLSLYFLREFMASKSIYNESYLNGEDYVMTPKTYGVNEYSVVDISYQQMANIYLNLFKNNIYTDDNYSYQLLNEEYRNLKFGSVESFINYFDRMDLNDLVMDKYSVNGDKTIYTVYTKNNNKFIFKVNSVMEFEVYLDDYTVEIW